MCEGNHDTTRKHKRSQAKPSQVRVVQAQLREARQDEARVGEVRFREARQDHDKTSQAKLGRVRLLADKARVCLLLSPLAALVLTAAHTAPPKRLRSGYTFTSSIRRERDYQKRHFLFLLTQAGAQPQENPRIHERARVLSPTKPHRPTPVPLKTVLHHTIPHHTILYHTVPCHIIPYHTYHTI